LLIPVQKHQTPTKEKIKRTSLLPSGYHNSIII
jgi:hypothetical protein